MSSPISYDLQGQGGGKILVAGQTVNAPGVRWVQCLTDCVFSTFSAPNLENSADITSFVIPAGVGIGGKIDSVGLISGLAIAYFA